MSQVPPVADWFQNGFHRFLRSYLRKHFHTVAISKAGWQPGSFSAGKAMSADEPLIVYGNHPAWWDPLIAHFVNRHCFAPRQFYAPIDASALKKYRVFAKLGFYGIDLSTFSGAAEFLKQSQAILAAPRTAIWLTPEGRFVDCRDHSAELMPGLSHLCSKMKAGRVVAMALEYTFMQERKPECLFRFSEPIEVSKAELTNSVARAVDSAPASHSSRACRRSAAARPKSLSVAGQRQGRCRRYL